MKKLVSLLLCLALLLSIAPAVAAENSTEPTEPMEPMEPTEPGEPSVYAKLINGVQYYVYDDHAEVVSVYQPDPGYDIFEIEETVDGKPVTVLKRLSLGTLEVASIIIPDTVTVLEESVFFHNTSLWEVHMSQNVETLSPEVFFGCTSLRLLHWPDNAYEITLETEINSSEDVLFPFCHGEPYFVTNPESKVHAFAKRGNYRVLPITEGIEYLTDGVGAYSTDGNEATLHEMYYENTNWDPNEYYMPDTICDIPITKISGDALWGIGLRTLYVGVYVEEIEQGAFERCKVEKLYLAENVTSLPYPLFAKNIEGVVYGYSNTYAEQFCREHGYSFRPLDVIPFEDVEKDEWYYNSVYFCYLTRLMNGTSDTTFAPNATTTRAMLVQVLYNMAGAPPVDLEMVFDDVKRSDWYADAVAFCQWYGLANGTSDKTFSPNQNVTREQVATFLCRYAAACDIAITANGELWQFTDADRVSNYAFDTMRWAVEYGIINGQTPTTLNPQGYATRAEIATMLMRFAVYMEQYSQ